MNDQECIGFLQWALPHLHMRWKGFRKVRGQVCKRIGRRLEELGLADSAAYRDYLERDPGEWEVLDGFCRITISRFGRDRKVFHFLHDTVLPSLAAECREGRGGLRCWSAGCASGEEPYTLSLLWRLHLRECFPGISLEIVATDSDPKVLERALAGRYESSSLKELDRGTVDSAFESSANGFLLNRELRKGVEFHLTDIRRDMPDGEFDLILCRNLVFTYFDEGLQGEILKRMLHRLREGGVLIIGIHESLPEGQWPLEPLEPGFPVYRKV
jgi:chemotaxis protein methyltransferase CheR